MLASMTPSELLSEGYASVDDLYDPEEEEWKKDVEEIQRIVRENNKFKKEYKEL